MHKVNALCLDSLAKSLLAMRYASGSTRPNRGLVYTVNKRQRETERERERVGEGVPVRSLNNGNQL